MSALDEIVRGIIEKYDAGNQEDAALASLIRKIREGKATYGDVERLASQTGTRAGQLIAAQLAELAVDGRVTDEQARALLMGMTRHNYDIVSGAAADVQERLNQRAGLGLKAVRPEFNQDRVEGLIIEVVGKEDVPAFRKTLTQQVENVSMATVDDSVKVNAKAHYNAGLLPKIKRVTDGKCCEWCNKLAGVYDYYQVNNTGNDVFRRHANCGCQVLYDPADGTKWQDVHSKRLLSADDRDKIKARIRAGQNEERKTPEQREARAERKAFLNRARIIRSESNLKAVSKSAIIDMESYKDITAYFKETHGIDVTGFDKKELLAIKSPLTGYDDMLQEFPELRGLVRKIQYNPWIEANGDIDLNTGISQVGKSGLFDYGTGIHEMSHMLDKVRSKSLGRINNSYADIILEKARKNLGIRKGGREYKDQVFKIVGLVKDKTTYDSPTEIFAYAIETAKGGVKIPLAEEMLRLVQKGAL